MIFSVVIPARDEERHIGACLESVARAAQPYPGEVEAIVVLNRCTDSTESITTAHGARIVREDARNLARIRNAGARAATGDVLVTVDADSTMSPDTFSEIERLLARGKFVGGGAVIRPERWSAGIFLGALILAAFVAPKGISGGLFWCCRADFEAIGGFNENLPTAEDIDFAVRLKAHGKARGKRFGTLWRAPIVTSCRKFDRFGDWFLVRMLLFHPIRFWRALHGLDPAVGDRYWYDLSRRTPD